MENQTSVVKNLTTRLQLRDWSILRIARLAIGGAILADAVPRGDWFFIAIGSVLFYQGVINQKCGGGSCEIPQK